MIFHFIKTKWFLESKENFEEKLKNNKINVQYDIDIRLESLKEDLDIYKECIIDEADVIQKKICKYAMISKN